MVAADLQELIDDLAAELGRPVSVEDRRWRLLGFSAHLEEPDPVRRASILQRHAPDEVVGWLEELGLAGARGVVDVPANDAVGMGARCCAPIRHGEVLLGFLWVVGAGVAHERVAEAAAAMAEVLWARRTALDAGRAAQRDALAALLRATGRPALERAAAALAEVVDWGPRDRWRVAAIPADEDAAERLRRRWDPGLVWAAARGGGIVVLARERPGRAGGPGDPQGSDASVSAARPVAALPGAARPPQGSDPSASAARPVAALPGAARPPQGSDPSASAARPGAALPGAVRPPQGADPSGPGPAGVAGGALGAALVAAGASPAGLSAVVARPHDVPRAAGAAAAAPLVPGAGPVAALDELGAWGTVVALWDGAGRPGPPPAVVALEGARHGEELLLALGAVLDAAGDVAHAAEALGVHRATLYRRLERVEELTGLDVHRGDDRLLLHLGLRVRQLSRAADAQRDG